MDTIENEDEKVELPELNDFIGHEIVKKVLLAVHEQAGFTLDKTDPIIAAALIQSGVNLELLRQQEKINEALLVEMDIKISEMKQMFNQFERMAEKIQKLQDNSENYLAAAKRVIIERAEAEGRPIEGKRKGIFGFFSK